MPANHFTEKDLFENPGVVAAACEEFGEVHVAVNGFDFRVTGALRLASESRTGTPMRNVPDFAARRKSVGMPVLDNGQTELLDRLLSGEDLES